MSLIDKIKKSSKIKDTAMLEESKLLNERDVIPTDIPILNIALSGSLDGGLASGLGMIAGPSKHFKSLMALLMARSFQKKYPEGVIVFYDSEFGSPVEYFKGMGIDTSRVVHKPIEDVEVLKHDITNLLNDLDREDKVFILVDSVGNLASKKEAEDAQAGKSVADMTRAKQLKSLSRIVTPHLTTKDIPMVMINHSYKTLELFSKDVVSGGTGIYYSSNWVWIIGRQQEKKAGEKQPSGYNFIINVEKSRDVAEKAKLPLSVSRKSGINKYSGIFDIALEAGFITKKNNTWYQEVDMETGEVLEKSYKKKDLAPVLNRVLADEKFKQHIVDTYKLSSSNLDQGLDAELEEELDEDDE